MRTFRSILLTLACLPICFQAAAILPALACPADTDGDGVCDAQDFDPLNPLVCRDMDADTCDDCSSGTDDPFNDGADFDADGICDIGDPDDDNDGIPDARSTNAGTSREGRPTYVTLDLRVARKPELAGETLRSKPAVPVMKPSDHWELDDSTLVRQLHLPRFRGVLLQGQVRSGTVMIVEVTSKKSTQVTFTEDDHMIDAVATQGSDQTFHVRSLPPLGGRMGLRARRAPVGGEAQVHRIPFIGR